MSRQLLCEPYLDAALHDVLLHLLSQIPDHMPYTDILLVLLLLLPSTNIIQSRLSNIHIRQQFSMVDRRISLDPDQQKFINFDLTTSWHSSIVPLERCNNFYKSYSKRSLDGLFLSLLFLSPLDYPFLAFEHGSTSQSVQCRVLSAHLHIL